MVNNKVWRAHFPNGKVPVPTGTSCYYLYICSLHNISTHHQFCCSIISRPEPWTQHKDETESKARTLPHVVPAAPTLTLESSVRRNVAQPVLYCTKYITVYHYIHVAGLLLDFDPRKWLVNTCDMSKHLVGASNKWAFGVWHCREGGNLLHQYEEQRVWPREGRTIVTLPQLPCLRFWPSDSRILSAWFIDMFNMIPL